MRPVPGNPAAFIPEPGMRLAPASFAGNVAATRVRPSVYVGAQTLLAILGGRTALEHCQATHKLA
jgi:hypothetical protein